MKCPHCGHKTPFVQFALTVMNPWSIRCPSCAKRYSIGKRGNAILLIGVIIAALVGLGIYDQSLLWIALAAAVFGALIEYLIWAWDEPVKK